MATTRVDIAGAYLVAVSAPKVDIAGAYLVAVSAPRIRIAGAYLVALATPPNAPTSPSAVAVSSTRIDFSWVDASTDETEFQVERAPDIGGFAGTFVLIATLPPGTTTYADEGRTPLTTYYYRVRAYNAAGYSGYSSAVDASTGSAPATIEVSGGFLRVTVPVDEDAIRTVRLYTATTYVFSNKRVTLTLGGTPDDYHYSSKLSFYIADGVELNKRVSLEFWVDDAELPKVAIWVHDGGTTYRLELVLNFGDHRFWTIYNEDATVWSIWSSSDNLHWTFRLRGTASQELLDAEKIVLEFVRDNSEEVDDTTTIFKVDGINCPE